MELAVVVVGVLWSHLGQLSACKVGPSGKLRH